jgi:hypothetical protein
MSLKLPWKKGPLREWPSWMKRRAPTPICTFQVKRMLDAHESTVTFLDGALAAPPGGTPPGQL